MCWAKCIVSSVFEVSDATSLYNYEALLIVREGCSTVENFSRSEVDEIIAPLSIDDLLF